jgi:hypothetical protein
MEDPRRSPKLTTIYLEATHNRHLNYNYNRVSIPLHMIVTLRHNPRTLRENLSKCIVIVNI